MNLQINKFLNLGKPWAIAQSEFSEIANLKEIALNMKPADISAKIEEFRKYDPQSEKPKILNKTAILPIHGTIMRYNDICGWFLGGATIENLQNQFRDLLNNKLIDNIVLDINSPGGDMDGVFELAKLIYESRGKKNIVSYIGFVGASAAYAIASAASKIVINESSVVGSIGVIMEFYKSDDKKPLTIISSISPKKNSDMETDEGKKDAQKFVDEMGQLFVKKIALHRAVEIEYVTNNFGQGGVRIGNDAITFKMADEIDILDNLIEKFNENDSNPGFSLNNTSGKRSKSMPKNKKFIHINSKKSNKTKAELVIVDDEEVDVPEDAESVDVINKEWIETNLPDVAEEFREEGRQEERDRQDEIDDVDTDDVPEEQEAKKEAKADGNMKASDLALKINAVRRKLKTDKLSKIKKDSEKIEGIQSDAGLNGDGTPSKNPSIQAAINEITKRNKK